ncbi:hypothetical protein ASPBRDRAFT_63796 [Aspergillus brasiliensis CBS 101740]|uniref:Uncharacterized protein n=1 Tax=Aspergillus brasiliensis (strain CBS 101740 / IMI 381727 / IBT 21946) TaxID=767769 RepID=A0A1L9UUE3_ASPBC|nr:hypothetical protein ASPBRDRAFT_63796 [Aspergillus brasiliensis CBS 101740]
MGDPLNGQHRSNEVDDPNQNLYSESDNQSGIGSENGASRPEDGPVQDVEGQDTHRNDEPANEDERPNLTDDANPPSSTEPGADQKASRGAEVKQDWYRISPTTLESNGFKEFRQKLEVAKGNTSAFSKRIRKLEQEKSVLERQNKEWEERIRQLTSYITVLELDVQNATAELNSLNSFLENL